jgi:2,5-diamino-6-(ribosylamino)-4(3H)-pyrimidinone 5'-phosphate reductase
MKPYVICHMMPSVDGRLRTERWDLPERTENEYDRVAESYDADAWVCGRVTMEEFARGRRRRPRGPVERLPRTDWVAPHREGGGYAVSLDPEGKLAWSSASVEGDHLIEVLGEDVADGYLAFLRDKGISYVFGGPKGSRLDLRLVLEKLREKFGIRTLMLEGGGETNGAFLRNGLIDELSLLVTPVADGRRGEPSLFDVEGPAPEKAVAKLRLRSVRKVGGGMVWIRYRVEKKKARRSA